jgi:glycerate dehydrogenase
MPSAVILDLATISRGDIDLTVLDQTSYCWQFHEETRAEDTLQRVSEAEVVVSNKVVLGREILQQCPQLKLICIAATGTNNVDLAAARELGIAVANVANYSTPAVVQHVFAMILGLTTRLRQYQDAVMEGEWQRSSQFCLLDFPIREIQGKVLGIVGYGNLGKAVARMAEAFGMEVRLAQRPGAPASPGRIELDRLLPQADILSLHCPLTPETKHLIGKRELNLMKTDALLINTARGGIVNETALAEALRQNKLGGAGIDVLEKEPPRAGNVLFDPDIPNLIITPHTAWASRESRQRLTNEVAENILAFTRGEKRNRLP